MIDTICPVKGYLMSQMQPYYSLFAKDQFYNVILTLTTTMYFHLFGDSLLLIKSVILS